MRATMTLLVVSLLILAPGTAPADTDDLFALSLRPNVLILIDGSGSMDDTDGGKYSVSYGVDLDQNGKTNCPGAECVADLDVDGVANTRNDVALTVVLDLLDANNDGKVDSKDEDILAVRLGLMYYTSGGDKDGSDARPRKEIDYSFETIALVGTPYADIKKAITDPIIAGVPDPNIVVGSLRGCSATPAEYSPSPDGCGTGSKGDQTWWGYGLDDTPTAESLEYIEHYWWPQQLYYDSERACRQNFVILITDGASDGFTPPEDIAASLYNGGVFKVHGVGVPEGFKDRFGKLILLPGISFTYEFIDKNGKLLTRDFTRQFTSGVTQVDVELASGVPGASPPADCPAGCYAYDPNGGDATGIPPANLGYVGGLNPSKYGDKTKIDTLKLLSSNTLDPEPPYYAKVFAVGFSGGDPGEIDRVAASGGSGVGFFPTTYAELTDAIASAITRIQQEALSVAAPSVPTARAATSNMLILASFTPSDDPFWYGELTAYPLNSDGTIQTDASGQITATPLWKAHKVLEATLASKRKIKTVLSGTTVQDFLGPNNALETALNVTTDVDGNGVVNSGDALYLIDYVRGDNGTDPAWKLGDIYHSSPVVVGPPSNVYIDLNLDRTIDTTFVKFRETFKTRDRVIYTGSNGGMLHAFHGGSWTGTDYDIGTGAERWGFVPPALLPKLKDMVNEHTYYVDSSSTAADVWLDGVSNDGSPVILNNVKNPFGAEWHTVLVTGLRKGGNSYFALDVTDPGDAGTPKFPKYLWTFTDFNLGETWSRPAIGKVKVSLDNGATTSERWVAFVGGGYSTATGSGFTYQFTDKDGVTLTREFTHQFLAGVTSVDVKLYSDVPGASPPPTCLADCFAYDPAGGDPTSIPAADLGYVGNLDSAIYGSGTKLDNLTLISSGGSAVGKAFFVIDMNTGIKLWEYTVTDDPSMALVPAQPTPVDTDRDGFVDRVYVGDLGGTIWRFDLQVVGKTSGLGTLVSGWTASKLFTATSGQPFYDRLAVAADPVGQLWVYGGTGDLNDLLDGGSIDRFYAIKEAYLKATGTPPATVPAVVTDADLADTTGLNTLNVYDPAFSGKSGWFLTLPPGEKILSDAEIFAGVLLFTSFTPTVATCDKKGGNTTLYALSYLTGGGASDYYAYKAGQDGLSKTVASYGGLSSGPRVSLPGRTSTGALSGGDVVLFVCTSGEVCGNPPAPQPGILRQIDYWRDL